MSESSRAATQTNRGPGDVWVFYHYLHPDDVVSAVHLDQLCQGLQQHGWAVTGFPCNRSCRDEHTTYPPIDEYRGVALRRIWRPRFRQSSSSGRLLNAAWMIVAWSLLALRGDAPDAVIVGTDPILSVLVALAWKFFSPPTRVIHWCFDLYPEAAYADGLLSPTSPVARLLAFVMRRAYRDCDAIVDIGPCMRDRLALYQSPATVATIAPWALEETASVLPVAVEEREQVCGEARLAMLYSGSFGRAHTFDGFLALARALRTASAALTFSVRGNREAELHHAVEQCAAGETCAIRFVPFASMDRLLDRIAAPDVHLLSLAEEWSGLVVPSKFFGALAVGRPVLFSGSAVSSIAQWINGFDLGWVLTAENAAAVAQDLMHYVNDPQRMAAMQQRCFDTYQSQFSRASGLDRMHALLSLSGTDHVL